MVATWGEIFRAIFYESYVVARMLCEVIYET